MFYSYAFSSQAPILLIPHEYNATWLIDTIQICQCKLLAIYTVTFKSLLTTPNKLLEKYLHPCAADDYFRFRIGTLSLLEMYLMDGRNILHRINTEHKKTLYKGMNSFFLFLAKMLAASIIQSTVSTLRNFVGLHRSFYVGWKVGVHNN